MLEPASRPQAPLAARASVIPPETPADEAADAPAAILYDGEDLVVRRDEGATDWTLVTFNESAMLAESGRYWGQSLARRNAIAAVGFVTRTPNWFPQEETSRAIAQVAPLVAGGGPRVLYGHSMGGYAAIKFSAALGAETVIAFCPQVSIDPAETGGYPVYATHFSARNAGMAIVAADVAGRIFVFYDPSDPPDRFHAARIAAVSSVTLVPLRHTGHDTIRCFASSELGKRLIALCRANDLRGLLQMAATRRRLFPDRPRRVALALAKRRPTWAMRILAAFGAAWMPEQTARICAAAGEGFFRRGEPRLAEECFVRATDLDPAQAGYALLRSVLLFYTGRPGEALDWADRALALDPGHAFARSHRAEVERKLAFA